MSRLLFASTAAASIAAAGAALVVAGAERPAARAIAVITRATAEEGRAPIYFQDPDGKPAYSLTPRKTPDGRDYRPVPAGADVSFDAEWPDIRTSNPNQVSVVFHHLGLRTVANPTLSSRQASADDPLSAEPQSEEDEEGLDLFLFDE